MPSEKPPAPLALPQDEQVRRWSTGFSFPIPLLRVTVGYYWWGAWRPRWKEPKEYWYRTILGPFYILHWRGGR